MKHTLTRRWSTAAAALMLGAGLVACAEESGAGNGAGGVGVPAGSDKQAYVDALADMEPVTLVMQSTAPKGAATGRRFEEYAAAVEDWSGGKITFDIAYSSAIAPVTEVDDALVDGRIDVGSVIVALEPSKFPVNSALGDLSFIGSQNPVDGMLQWHGAMIQAAVESEAALEEFEANGMHPLLPTFGSGSYFLDCAEPGATQEELSGRTVASQSRVQNAEVEALGMSPSTISYAEMFESLERGVVDCAVSSMTTSLLGGFIPAAPHLAYSPTVGLGAPGGTIAIGQSRWESLPLAARQLLQDRMDVLLEANFGATWENVNGALAAIDEAGGEVALLGEDAEAAIAEANGSVLEEVRTDNPELVESLSAAEERWNELVAELDVPGIDVDYAGFREWYAENGEVDLSSYFTELQDVMSPLRPE